MSKTYTYKKSEYRVKDNNLKQLRILQPLKKELARLTFEATKGIDRSILLKYQQRLKQLNLEIYRMKERKEDTTAKENELKELIQKYETDSEVATLNNFIESQNESVMLDLFFNEDLMRQSIPAIVEGDYSIFNYDEDEFYLFAGQVISDFFLSMRKQDKN